MCITASGSIPESYSIDFSVVSYDVTAQSAVGEDDREWSVGLQDLCYIYCSVCMCLSGV